MLNVDIISSDKHFETFIIINQINSIYRVHRGYHPFPVYLSSFAYSAPTSDVCLRQSFYSILYKRLRRITIEWKRYVLRYERFPHRIRGQPPAAAAAVFIRRRAKRISKTTLLTATTDSIAVLCTRILLNEYCPRVSNACVVPVLRCGQV